MAWFQAFLMFFSLIFLLSLPEAAGINKPGPGCKNKCGNVDIPYPFGIGTDEGCSIDNEYFYVTCNDTHYDPPRPFLTDGNIDVSNISVLDGQINVMLPIANDCSDKKIGNDPTWTKLSKFTFSDTRNKFIAIGCDIMAYLKSKDGSYGTGCMSFCDSIDDVINGSCAGIGCCETSIPKGLRRYDATVESAYTKRRNYSFNPCSYAFLAEENWFKFSSAYLKDFYKFWEEGVPAVLEWTIGNQTCDVAKIDSTSYSCGPNTDCYDNLSSPGYRCKCKKGYEGNPYLTGTDGCQDVDECSRNINPCKGLRNICQNTNGSHNCICPSGYHMNQIRDDGTSDCAKPDSKLLDKILIGTGIGLLFLLVSISWLYWGFRKRRLMQLKEKFFKQNGGMLLKQVLEREESIGSRTAKIFTAEELKQATNKFDESQILGKGGFGTVYKGTLSNGDVVAIKKSKVIDKTQIDQFINEVLVLSQINHTNVVKLLGCCLETEVPLLVYEFITNGTLFEHLHDHENRVALLSWDNRLRIAVEVAESLAYLHSAAAVPIIHRDVKSSNVLLDDSYKAKVSDFGASKLVPIDQTELTTLVQGTLGYLDPEYFHTSQLTDKSDVYSFGVLLAELLTGKMALSFDRPEKERSLSSYFLSSMKDDSLLQILDYHFVTDMSIDERQLKQVAELTKTCLRVKGEKRPTMKEVAMMLAGLRKASNHPWVFNDASGVFKDAEANNNTEENEYLLGEGQSVSYSNSAVVGYDSMNNQTIEMSSLNLGR